MIFLNSVELMSFLNDVLYDKLREKPPEDIRVEIATYGLSFSDKKFENCLGELKTRESMVLNFLNTLMDTNTDMVVGMPPMKKYKNSYYGETAIDRKKRLEEMEDIMGTYRINVYPVEESHFKFYRIDDIYITGGINLTDSTWNDAAVLIEKERDKEQLEWYFQQILDRAKAECRKRGIAWSA
nr:MAG TPA: CDP-alcohol phosphatidyltransferase class-II family protein [Bacteriophage sp.]